MNKTDLIKKNEEEQELLEEEYNFEYLETTDRLQIYGTEAYNNWPKIEQKRPAVMDALCNLVYENLLEKCNDKQIVFETFLNEIGKFYHPQNEELQIFSNDFISKEKDRSEGLQYTSEDKWINMYTAEHTYYNPSTEQDILRNYVANKLRIPVELEKDHFKLVLVVDDLAFYVNPGDDIKAIKLEDTANLYLLDEEAFTYCSNLMDKIVNNNYPYSFGNQFVSAYSHFYSRDITEDQNIQDVENDTKTRSR